MKMQFRWGQKISESLFKEGRAVFRGVDFPETPGGGTDVASSDGRTEAEILGGQTYVASSDGRTDVEFPRVLREESRQCVLGSVISRSGGTLDKPRVNPTEEKSAEIAVIYLQDGSVFEGFCTFNDGFSVSGKGKLDKGNVTYVGHLEKNELVGEGKVLREDGTVFREGMFGNEYFEGKISWRNGIVEEGKFNYDNELLEGERILPDGTVEKGRFQNGKLIIGKRIRKDGSVRRVIFGIPIIWSSERK